MGSFFMLAISGIVINITVTALRDAAALGVFNLAYAVYIVISQFAVWGLHYSVLRHTAYYKESDYERGSMFFTAGVIALFLGVVFAGLTAISAPFAGGWFDSRGVGTAISYAAFGLTLFPLNKVLLNYLNGLREMKAFSVLQGLRYFLLMTFVSTVAATDLPIEIATLGFLFAEAITAFGALIFLVKYKHHLYFRFSSEWVRKHFSFGSRGLAGGMFAEVNSRIDVLLIGFFLTDRETGIYSFAAMLVDGLYHVLAMIRINFNPVLVTAVRDKDWGLIERLRTQSARYVFPAVVGLSLLLILAYYIISIWVVPGKGMLEGLPSLLILLCGITIISIFVPFDNLMMVSGHPGFQAIQQMVTVIANAFIAILLLPLFGIEGAAIGTAVSYVVGVGVLILFAYRLFGLRLLTNQPPASNA
jgi:O-antigen/teichoic acid export membrane protein